MADNDTARALGEVQGTVRALQDQWARQDSAATAGRHALRERIDRLAELQIKTDQKVDHLIEKFAEKFAEIQPVIDRAEIARHRSAGARWVLGIIWGMFATGIAAIAYVLHDWAGVIGGLLWPPKH